MASTRSSRGRNIMPSYGLQENAWQSSTPPPSSPETSEKASERDNSPPPLTPPPQPRKSAIDYFQCTYQLSVNILMDKKRVMAITRPYTWAEFNWKCTQEEIEDQLAAVAPVDAD